MLDSDNFYDQFTAVNAHPFMQKPPTLSLAAPPKKKSEAVEDSQESNNTVSIGPIHFEVDPVTGVPRIPGYDRHLNYMDEYWNIYLQN